MVRTSDGNRVPDGVHERYTIATQGAGMNKRILISAVALLLLSGCVEPARVATVVVPWATRCDTNATTNVMTCVASVQSQPRQDGVALRLAVAVQKGARTLIVSTFPLRELSAEHVDLYIDRANAKTAPRTQDAKNAWFTHNESAVLIDRMLSATQLSAGLTYVSNRGPVRFEAPLPLDGFASALAEAEAKGK